MKHFSLTADSNPRARHPYTYRDDNDSAQDKYTVVPEDRIDYPVDQVQITAGKDVLTLCEVSVFGGELKKFYELLQ